MKRTQIQFPEALYREVQRVAALEEWSIAEVIRRGVEQIVRSYPPIKHREAFRLPAPIASQLLVTNPECLRDLIRSDHEGVIP